MATNSAPLPIRRRAGSLVLLAFAALHGARGLDFHEVATARELQDALTYDDEAVLITIHLDFSASGAKWFYDANRYDAACLRRSTAIITGRCNEPPRPELRANWRPGQCVLYVTNLSAFTILGGGHEPLWIDNLHVALGASDGTKRKRYALFTEPDHAAPLYLTRLTIEGLAGAPTSDTAIYLRTSLIASDLRVLNVGPSSRSPVWLTTAAYHNSTLSLINSTFAGNDVYKQGSCPDEWGYCWPSSILSHRDTRLKGVTFEENTAPIEYDIRLYNDAQLFSDQPVTFERLTSNQTAPGLAEEALDLSQTIGRPFLSFEDAWFLDMHSEVASSLPEEAPVVGPSPGPAAGPAFGPATEPAIGPSQEPVSPTSSGDINDSPPPSDGSATSAIAGAIGGVLATVLVTVAGLFVWRRYKRPRHAPDPPQKGSEGTVAGLAVDATNAHSGGAGAVAVSMTPTAARPPQPHRASQAEFVTMTHYTGGNGTPWCLPTATDSKHGSGADGGDESGTRPKPRLSQPQFVTMTAFTDTDPTSTIRVATTTTTTRSRAAQSTGTRALSARHARSIEVLDDALDVMHEQRQYLMGRWEVLNAANRRIGGQAIVQFVKDVSSGEELVVKFFLDRVAFQREAELYKQSHMREIMAAVLDVQANADGAVVAPDGTVFPPFIVLERGRSLDEWALTTAPDYPTSLQVLVQIVDRLKRLHALRMVHRDIKPANILWRNHKGQWTLIDFGCAVAAGSECSIACSVPYAPPEVAVAMKEQRKTLRVEASADIWSLGVVIYELLTDERAFGSGRSADEIMGLLTSSEPLPWEPRHPRASRMRDLGMVRKIVRLCLSRDPRERPTTEQLLSSLNGLFYAATTHAQKQSSASST